MSETTASLHRETVVSALIHSSTVTATEVIVEDDGIKIVWCQGTPAVVWYDVYHSDRLTPADEAELRDLEARLGQPLVNCLVEAEVYPCIPGLVGTLTYYRRYSPMFTKEVKEL